MKGRWGRTGGGLGHGPLDLVRRYIHGCARILERVNPPNRSWHEIIGIRTAGVSCSGSRRRLALGGHMRSGGPMLVCCATRGSKHWFGGFRGVVWAQRRPQSNADARTCDTKEHAAAAQHAARDQSAHRGDKGRFFRSRSRGETLGDARVRLPCCWPCSLGSRPG